MVLFSLIVNEVLINLCIQNFEYLYNPYKFLKLVGCEKDNANLLKYVSYSAIMESSSSYLINLLLVLTVHKLKSKKAQFKEQRSHVIDCLKY